MNGAACYYLWNLPSYECGLVLGTNISFNKASFAVYLQFFLLTCLFESIFYFYFGKLQKLVLPQILKQIFVLNLATHPIVFFAFPYFLEKMGSDVFTYIWTAELFAFTIEALILKFHYHYCWRKALGASGLANLFSWTVGIWLQTLGLL